MLENIKLVLWVVAIIGFAVIALAISTVAWAAVYVAFTQSFIGGTLATLVVGGITAGVILVIIDALGY